MATDAQIGEVKERLSFICREDRIREVLNWKKGGVKQCVFHLECTATKIRATGISHLPPWYMGDKPAGATAQDPERSRRLEHDYFMSAANMLAIRRAHFIDGTDPIVTVNVGHEAVSFQVHQSTLCRTSEFFQSRAKPEWSRGKAAVDLAHISAEAFAVYVNWLYGNTVMPRGKKLWEKDIFADSSDWVVLAESVALGEQLMDSAFQHSVMDMMIVEACGENAEQMLRVAELYLPVQIIYDSIPDSSGARSLIVDIFKLHPGLLESCGNNELPADFLRALALEALQKTEGLKDRLLKDKCWYHKHSEGEDCYSTTSLFPGGILN
ncbi:hypothetical protein CBER1_00149 [Cercospora berteroae]|uniref:BTB domain-containing protein n=1 Tax=Cercospora berteroae TaxID=357750 RepID=A0A2S6CD73_9PEZI|nr:hypothetical protein CBER1_00149 [Cercospora berteroae]